MIEMYNELIIGIMKIFLLGFGFYLIIGIVIKLLTLKLF